MEGEKVYSSVRRIEGIGTVRSVGTLNLEKLIELLLKSSLAHKP